MWIAKCGSSLYLASQAQLTVHQLTLFIIRWYFWMAFKHCAIIVRAFLKVWYSLQCCDRDIKFIITSNSTCTVVFQLPVFHTCTWQLSDNFYLENNSFKKKNFLLSLGQKKKSPFSSYFFTSPFFICWYFWLTLHHAIIVTPNCEGLFLKDLIIVSVILISIWKITVFYCIKKLGQQPFVIFPLLIFIYLSFLHTVHCTFCTCILPYPKISAHVFPLPSVFNTFYTSLKL